MKFKFCYIDCENLTITEEEQKLAPHVEHFCKEYNKRVYHRKFHPSLLRLRECKYNRGKVEVPALDELPLLPKVNLGKCDECRFNKSRGCILKLKLPCRQFAPKRKLPPKNN